MALILKLNRPILNILLLWMKKLTSHIFYNVVIKSFSESHKLYFISEVHVVYMYLENRQTKLFLVVMSDLNGRLYLINLIALGK